MATEKWRDFLVTLPETVVAAYQERENGRLMVDEDGRPLLDCKLLAADLQPVDGVIFQRNVARCGAGRLQRAVAKLGVATKLRHLLDCMAGRERLALPVPVEAEAAKQAVLRYLRRKDTAPTPRAEYDDMLGELWEALGGPDYNCNNSSKAASTWLNETLNDMLKHDARLRVKLARQELDSARKRAEKLAADVAEAERELAAAGHSQEQTA